MSASAVPEGGGGEERFNQLAEGIQEFTRESATARHNVTVGGQKMLPKEAIRQLLETFHCLNEDQRTQKAETLASTVSLLKEPLLTPTKDKAETVFSRKIKGEESVSEPFHEPTPPPELHDS
ncbi:MAG: hypothetical protein ACE5GN_00930 [Waddliaceae bacterium]